MSFLASIPWCFVKNPRASLKSVGLGRAKGSILGLEKSRGHVKNQGIARHLKSQLWANRSKIEVCTSRLTDLTVNCEKAENTIIIKCTTNHYDALIGLPWFYLLLVGCWTDHSDISRFQKSILTAIGHRYVREVNIEAEDLLMPDEMYKNCPYVWLISSGCK